MRAAVFVYALRKHPHGSRVDRLVARHIIAGYLAYAVALPNVVAQGEPKREIGASLIVHCRLLKGMCCRSRAVSKSPLVIAPHGSVYTSGAGEIMRGGG